MEGEDEGSAGGRLARWQIGGPAAEAVGLRLHLVGGLPAVGTPAHRGWGRGNDAESFAGPDPRRLMRQGPDLEFVRGSSLRIPLVNRLDSIEADAVPPAAHERDVFPVRPAKRHRGSG